MTTPVLGGHTFLETPTVNGVPVLLVGDVTPSPVLNVWSANIAPTTGTTLIPYDASAPLITEGTQIWTQTVTPVSNTSRFNVHFDAFVAAGSGTRYTTIALFRGNTCVGVSTQLCATANAPYQLTLREMDSPATTATITYSLRIGNSSNSSWYIGQTVTGTYAGLGAVNVTMMELP